MPGEVSGWARGRPPPALDPRPEAQRGPVPAGLAFGRFMWLALARRAVDEGALGVHGGTRHEHVHERELCVFLSETCRQSADRAPTPCSPPLPSPPRSCRGREGLHLNSQAPCTPSSSPPQPPCHPATPGPRWPRGTGRGRSSSGLRTIWARNSGPLVPDRVKKRVM